MGGQETKRRVVDGDSKKTKTCSRTLTKEGKDIYTASWVETEKRGGDLQKKISKIRGSGPSKETTNKSRLYFQKCKGTYSYGNGEMLNCKLLLRRRKRCSRKRDFWGAASYTKGERGLVSLKAREWKEGKKLHRRESPSH